MADIIAIEKPPRQSVIQHVEELLQRVKSGEVLGVVVIQSFADNCTNHTWSGIVHNSVRITGELMIAASAIAGLINEDRM